MLICFVFSEVAVRLGSYMLNAKTEIQAKHSPGGKIRNRLS